MALAVDASTPARATGSTTNGTLTATTATFDPPAAVLVATVQSNDRNAGAGGTGAITNNAAALTWDVVAEQNLLDVGGLAGYAGIFVAVLGAGRTGMTVTFTMTPGSGGAATINTPSIKLYVVTGAAASPIGASAQGSSTTNNLTTTAFTTSGASSLGFASGCEQNALGPPTSSDATVDAFGAAGVSISGVSGYKTLGGAGSSATVNLDAGSTGAAVWNWVTAEILADTGPPPAGDPLRLPIQTIRVP